MLPPMAKMAVTLLCRPNLNNAATMEDYISAVDFAVDAIGQLSAAHTKVAAAGAPFKEKLAQSISLELAAQVNWADQVLKAMKAKLEAAAGAKLDELFGEEKPLGKLKQYCEGEEVCCDLLLKACESADGRHMKQYEGQMVKTKAILDDAIAKVRLAVVGEDVWVPEEKEYDKLVKKRVDKVNETIGIFIAAQTLYKGQCTAEKANKATDTIANTLEVELPPKLSMLLKAHTTSEPPIESCSKHYVA